MSEAARIAVGKIGAPHGLDGWVKVHACTDPLTAVLECPTWWLQVGKTWQEFKLEKGQPHGKCLIVHLQGCNDRDAAKSLTSATIEVCRDDLPELSSDEYYWDDLIGLTVIDTQDKYLGTITRIIETGANDVLVVKPAIEEQQQAKQPEHLIPFVLDEIVKWIDLEKQQMCVEWDTTFLET